MTQDLKHKPDASVILVASKGIESIAKVMNCLRVQTSANQLEIVLAARPDDVAELRRIPQGDFCGITVVAADLSTSARARAGAIHQAQASIILFCEDHAFPIGDEWAARLIEAHKSDHTGIGPVMRNANPGTRASWANFVVEYGSWINAEMAGPSDTLPGHNSSYKRDALLAYGDALAEMLEAEWVMHMDMRKRGMTLCIEPMVEVEHLNFSRVGRTMRLHFLEGWMFAASRAENWSFGRRAIYALAFPAIVGVRFIRAGRQLYGCAEAAPHALGSLPICLAYLTISGIGETLGYTLGDCGRRQALGQMEYDRWRNIRDNEGHLALPQD